MIRLIKLAKELNRSFESIIEEADALGYDVVNNPTTRISDNLANALRGAYLSVINPNDNYYYMAVNSEGANYPHSKLSEAVYDQKCFGNKKIVKFQADNYPDALDKGRSIWRKYYK